jgi:hypothetical protein
MVKGKEKELTFRELQAYCAREIEPLDGVSPAARLSVQRHMDPNYKPLSPYEGLNRFRRRLR